MSRTATRVGASVVALGLVALALPANAASSYAPGDLVTVDGAGVTAPAPGKTVALSIDRVGAPSTTLVVSTATDGTVTVSDGTDGTAAAAPDGGPDKCDDNDYTLLDGSSWPGTYEWHFKKSSTPNELTKKKAKKAMKRSVGNITDASNDCGEADQVSATHSYEGSTSSSSDVNGSNLTCDATPNGLNVTEFGDITGTGVLAATCTYSGFGGDITAASVLVNTDFEWWISGSCSFGAYGLKAVQTHEYGHAFGVGHVDETNHGNLTMSTNINDDCSNFEASLGLGDILALEDLY